MNYKVAQLSRHEFYPYLWICSELYILEQERERIFGVGTLEGGSSVKEACGLDYSRDGFYWVGDSGSTTVASVILSVVGP